MLPCTVIKAVSAIYTGLKCETRWTLLRSSLLCQSRSRSCLGSRRDYLCVCRVFALHSIITFVHFATHLTEESSFSLIIWLFKENFKLDVVKIKDLSTTEIQQKVRCEKNWKNKIQKTETVSPKSLGLDTSLFVDALIAFHFKE
jgi:hypothetical protein